jgi:hypothetical protein
MNGNSVYMAAFDDLIKDASSARFLYAVIGKIFTREIIMTKDGTLESYGFGDIDEETGEKIPGFRLKAQGGLFEAIKAVLEDLIVNRGTFKDIRVTGNSVFGAVDGNGNLVGNIEFFGKITAKNGSTFEGKITAGEIEATNITVNGTVAPGTDFVLKSNNNTVRGYLSSVPVKEILTYAKGTCRVNVMFPPLPSTEGTNGGKYKITVADKKGNGETVIRDWTDYSGSSATVSIDVTLKYNPTKVRLYMDTRDAGGPVSYMQINTIFELRCEDNPGILGAF